MCPFAAKETRPTPEDDAEPVIPTCSCSCPGPFASNHGKEKGYERASSLSVLPGDSTRSGEGQKAESRGGVERRWGCYATLEGKVGFAVAGSSSEIHHLADDPDTPVPDHPY